MSTLRNGRITEALTLSAFAQWDVPVLLPFGEGQPYDLVVDIQGSFVRVQCKTAWRSGDRLMFNAMATDHGHGHQSYDGLADLFGVGYPPDSSVFLVPVRDTTTRRPYLRIKPARNNQQRGIRMATDFAFERWTPERLRKFVLDGAGTHAAA